MITSYNQSTKTHTFFNTKRNADYLAMIDKSTAEAEAGGFITKGISELETYE